MEHRILGASGLKVPVLSMGTGTFGGSNDFFKGFGSADVKEATRGVYHVEYQPIVAGTYQMTVLAGGKPLEGSPFEVKVAGLQRADTKPVERASEVSEELLNSTASLKGKAAAQA